LRFLLGVLLCSCLFPAAVGWGQNFQPMFKGQDFSGWVRTNTPPETWRFEDGMLICSGKPIGEIRTEKMYQNFIMELEWRHMVPRGNAGVFIWADDIPARGVPFHRGIEVQVLENEYGNNKSHTTHGDIFPIHGAKMTPVNGRGGSRAFPTEFRSNPSPQWNHYRIECRDGEISLAVNGKVVTRGKNCSPRKGYICLESEGGIVHYRNVKIRELPGGPVPEDETAIADRGYESIYTGLNLEGWEASDSADRWSANDWVLSYRDDASQEGTLHTTDARAIQRLIVDVRLQSTESSATISLGDAIEVPIDAANHPEAFEGPGSWNRVEAVIEEGTCTVTVNDKTIQQTSCNVQPRKLQLNATGKVDFCNVFVAVR